MFQYAAWALDIEMAEVILKYLDSSMAMQQLKDLETHPEQYSTYGAHYDMTPLIQKTQSYVDNYRHWTDDECEHHWQQDVGGPQRQAPAWLIYVWCEEGEKVAWTELDFTTHSVNRQYDKKHVERWFSHKYNGGGGVGSKWAVVRGQLKTVIIAIKLIYTITCFTYINQDIRSIKAVKRERLEKLQDRLLTPLHVDSRYTSTLRQ